MDENKLKTLAITLRWENRYRTQEYLSGEGAFVPELETLDIDFAQALELNGKKCGKLLEIGTGLGIQAIRYAQFGCNVTATDVSFSAIENARKKAVKEGGDLTQLNFVQDNILMSKLQGTFDIIADRGCYATLKEWEYESYCNAVYRLLNKDGLFLLKINAGQYEITQTLKTRFNIIKSYDTHYHGTLRQGPPAVFITLKPLASQDV